MSLNNHHRSPDVGAARPVAPAFRPTPAVAQPVPAGLGYLASPPDEPRRSVWQSPMVQNVLPFVTSLSVHAAIICVGLLTYKAITIVAGRPSEDPGYIPFTDQIVDTKFVDDGSKHTGPLLNSIEAQQDKSINETIKNAFTTHSSSGDLAADRGGAAGERNDSVIGVGPGGGFAVGNTKRFHRGPGEGDGDGAGGAMARFGVPRTGGGDGLGSGLLFHPPIGAHRIAYVCDASGSMINKMPALKVELNKALQHLKPVQGFSVIFFRELKPDSFSNVLMAATPETKARAGRFVEDETTFGKTDPIPGIELAFKQQPEVIFLLTDGDFPDNDAVQVKIRLLNKDHRVRINTIAFVGSADTDVAFKALLETIAQENGGTYKLVSPDDL